MVIKLVRHIVIVPLRSIMSDEQCHLKVTV